MPDRRWIVPLLLLSIGVNLGLLIALAAKQIGRSDDPRDGFRERPQATAPNDGNSRERLERLAQRLELRGPTLDTFIERQGKFFERTEQLRQQRDQTRRALHRALIAEHPDREQIAHQLDVLATASAAMERAFAEHVLDARELLDGESERRYLRFLEHMISRRGERGPDRSGRRRGRFD